MIGLAALLATAATVPTVISPKPERLAVTVYRDPTRTRDARMDLRFLGGFALISETRTVRLPAGEAVLRFEGVAGGIVPASAVIEGLPGGTIEKNRDARLLSPAALVDGTLGRRVTIQRTDKASGQAREEEAVIVSGPANGVVLRTAAGLEALRCSGLGEALRYDRVPAGLSAKPTLSVTTRSPRAAMAKVTLSYLASEFDWSASYVATIAPDGSSLDLFAWLTLANANREAFPAAETQAVAGRLERRRVERLRAAAGRLELHCYPLGTTTSDLRAREDIVVTASRRFEARGMMLQMAMAAPVAPPPPPPPPPPPEDLGDLKLYRLPERVDIAPNAQKQVALLAAAAVPFERLYRVALYPGQAARAVPASILLRMRNEEARGLGIPLPAGTTAIYADRAGQRLLVGTGTLGDLAKGERLTLAAGASRQVTATQIATEVIGGERRMRVTLANANPFAVTVEVPIGWAGQETLLTPSTPLPRVDGVQTWQVALAANGEAALDYGYR